MRLPTSLPSDLGPHFWKFALKLHLQQCKDAWEQTCLLLATISVGTAAAVRWGASWGDLDHEKRFRAIFRRGKKEKKIQTHKEHVWCATFCMGKKNTNTYECIYLLVCAKETMGENQSAVDVQWGGGSGAGRQGSVTFRPALILDLRVPYSHKYNSLKSTGEGTLELNTNRNSTQPYFKRIAQPQRRGEKNRT